jgi:hypothetical protein
MICTGNRVHVQTEVGESDILVLMAIAKASYELAPRGRDCCNEFRRERALEPDEIADLIECTPNGYELIMVHEVHGRACSTHVAPTLGIKGAFEVNRDLYEGSIVDLLERAQELMADLLRMNGQAAPAHH